MGIREYSKVLFKHWMIIVIVTVLGLLVGLGYSLIATEKYQSRTQLYVSVRSQDGTTGELAQGATYSRQIVNSYVDVIRSSVVLDPVVEELALDISSTELASKVTAVSPKQTALINVTVTDTSPEDAAKIANSIGESFKRVVQSNLETDVKTGISPINLTTTQVAETPTAPVSPNLIKNLIIGILAGFLLGFGIAILRNVLDTRIHSLDDVRDITSIPLLGGVIDDPNAKQNPLVIRTKPYSPRSESFRALRTNLQFVNVDKEASIFVMTSPNPGEGKSTTSANLALAIAETGAKVALIEADLRLPMVHKYMNVEGAAGLTDVLIGKADVEDVLQRWGRTNLYFLPAGRIPPNPSELLSSSAMNAVLEELGEEFDFIIIDAPPVLSVTDAAVIGHGKTGILVAVASGSTQKMELQGALNALNNAGANVVGIIVTMLQQNAAGRYGYGNYGYGQYGNRDRKEGEQDAVILDA
ncbi:polysaccharide biosynthesis tyrosine autokinase [Corynebacterium sp. H128]|uniref:polysaccharide biosynthesis tyrosine autokinase n=1 Tax=Corynebacterium sp. H128 TaxID=3133427 RepID=UPI0030A4B3D2